MRGNRSKNLPAFSSVDEFVAFFETHDMGEYWEKLPEIEVQVSIRNSKRKTKTKTSTNTGMRQVPEGKRQRLHEFSLIYLREWISLQS